MMKIKNVFYLMIGLTFMMTSCSGEESVEEETIERIEIEGLALNDGEKWTANIETTQGVHNMMALYDQDYESQENYQNLATNLSHEKDEIFSHCNMKGEAHENLHSFLMPLIKMIKDLADSKELTKSEGISNSIEIHLNQFDFYFKN